MSARRIRTYDKASDIPGRSSFLNRPEDCRRLFARLADPTTIKNMATLRKYEQIMCEYFVDSRLCASLPQQQKALRTYYVRMYQELSEILDMNGQLQVPAAEPQQSQDAPAAPERDAQIVAADVAAPPVVAPVPAVTGLARDVNARLDAIEGQLNRIFDILNGTVGNSAATLEKKVRDQMKVPAVDSEIESWFRDHHELIDRHVKEELILTRLYPLLPSELRSPMIKEEVVKHGITALSQRLSELRNREKQRVNKAWEQFITPSIYGKTQEQVAAFFSVALRLELVAIGAKAHRFSLPFAPLSLQQAQAIVDEHVTPAERGFLSPFVDLLVEQAVAAAGAPQAIDIEMD